MFKKLFSRKSHETVVASPEVVLGVVFTAGEDGYIIAECPQLPGCMSQGKTKDEARRNIMEAMQAVISVRLGHLLEESDSRHGKNMDSSEEECFRVKEPELVSI
jgi:predicted RNase H-like HicB family nuclease